MIKGCPDGNGCTLQEAQTVCSSVFGSYTSGIVFEPTTLAQSHKVLRTAHDAADANHWYWIGVNNGDLTYLSNGNPVSFTIPWQYSHPISARDCVFGISSIEKWVSWNCDDSSVKTICEMTS